MASIGDKKYHLTITELERTGKRLYYLCNCDCGKKTRIRSDEFGKTKSCGCAIQKDIKNKRYGTLVAVEKLDRKVRNGCVWLCRCDCGNEIEVTQNDLDRDRKRNCGCKREENLKSSVENARKINGCKNLKDGTSLAQISRSEPTKANKSGVRGVHKHKKSGKWVAQITFKGKTTHLGYFSTLEEAALARKKAEEEVFKPVLEKYSE